MLSIAKCCHKETVEHVNADKSIYILSIEISTQEQSRGNLKLGIMQILKKYSRVF